MNRCQAVGCDREVAAKHPSEIWTVPTNHPTASKREHLFEKALEESIWVCGNLGEKKHQHELSEICLVSQATQPNQQHPTNLVGPSLVPRNAHQPNQPPPWTRKNTQPRVFPRSLNLAICQFAGIFMCSKLMLLSPVDTLLTTPPKKASFQKSDTNGPGIQFLVMVNLQLFIASAL